MASSLWTRIVPLVILAALVVAAVAYRMSNSAPDPARGREIVQRMSDRLSSAKTLSLTTDEVRVRTTKDAEPVRRAVGTMLARPPAAAVTISVGGSSYWYNDGVYLTRVMSGGGVSYQVVGAPVGAVIRTLPAGCSTVRVGGVAYSQCGPTYYQRVGAGYQVVVLR